MTSGHAEIPPSIEDLWKSLLDCIRQESGKEDWAAVADTLRLLSVSQRGLDAEEIHDYLSYDRDSSTWGRYRFSDSFGVWRRFPALLQLAGRPGKEGRPNGCTDNLGLIHPSLQELLQSDAIRRGPSGVFAIEPTKAQEEVAIRCVSYLLRYNSPNSYTSRRGWTAYAGTYWHQHVKKLGPAASEELTAHCIKLLDHRTPSFSHWTYMNRRYGDIDTSEDGDFGVQDIYPSPLYYAALLGLHQCAMKLVRDGADAHAGGGKHEYSIVAAVVAGEEEIVELLATEIATNSTLPRDAALNGAATNAAILGRPRMLQKLLELGADVSYRDKFEWTMAHWAAKNYHIDCLRTLAEFSADFDARNLTGSTPLLLASYVGSIPIMEFLLSSKVDMSFAVAAEAGQREAVDLLLANGANANAATAHRLTALCYASAQLNLPMVISLLNYGADTNWRTDFGRTPTPLHFAVTPKTAPPSEQDTPSNMIRAVVEALLSHGADPCIPDGDGRLVEEKTTDPELKEILGRYR